jgi:hypothetical protein
VNCPTSTRSICIVSAAMDSAMSWGSAGSRRGYNLRRDDGVSFHDRDGWRERTHRMRRPSAPVEQIHTFRVQVLDVDPEALELALDLIRPGIAN